MKKSLLSLALLSLLYFSSYAQDNKPEANSFGLQYGISYSGTLNQELGFSGWLNKGIEIRGGLLLSFTQTDSKLGNNDSIYLGSIKGYIAGYTYSESKSGSITITPNLSVLKHFSTKNNIDPFVGGLVSTSISMQTIQTQTINEASGNEYDRYTNSLTKTPITAGVGLSLVGGVNYFFAKNFAIGVDAGFGFTTSITNGTRYLTSINRNTGTNNPSTLNESTTSASNSNIISYALNLSGNGGLRFTYYLRTKTGKPKSGEQKM